MTTDRRAVNRLTGSPNNSFNVEQSTQTRANLTNSSDATGTIFWSESSNNAPAASANFASAKKAVEQTPDESASADAMLNQETIEDLRRAAVKNNAAPNT